MYTISGSIIYLDGEFFMECSSAEEAQEYLNLFI